MSVQSLGQTKTPTALRTTLAAATRRIRMLRMLRDTSRALCLTSVVGLLAVGLSKLRLFETPAPWTLAALIGTGLIAAVLLALLRPLAELDVARLTEKRADLKERLSSAVEFQRLSASGQPFYDAQLADADRHAAGVDLRALYPLRLPRTLFVGLFATLALFLAFYLPTLPAFWSPRQKEEMAQVKKQGIQIVKLAQDAQKAADLQKLDETKKAAEEAQKLGEAMKKGLLTKKAALVEMQKLTRKMEEAQKKLAASLPTKPMEQAQRELKKSMDQMQKEVQASQQKKAEEAKQAEKNAQGKKSDADKKDANNKGDKPNAQKKPGEKQAGQKQNPQTQAQPQPSPAMKQIQKAMEQMQQAMQQQDAKQMQQAMQQMAQQMQSGQMSKQDMQQMQQAMQQMAQALANTSQDKAAKQMQELAQQMQQMMGSMDSNSMQQMAQMMNQIGKQMGKGMGMGKMEMDAQMLKDLAEALKDGRLTMAMGKGMFPGNGMGGKGPGNGWNGSGNPTQAMKEPKKTKPRLIARGPGITKPGVGKAGKASDFAKYLMAPKKAPKYLPNGKIAGSRLENGQELQQNFTGDPEKAQSSSQYYSVYQTNRRAAESALDKENIPAAYKKQVRDYFDSIKP